MQDHHHPRDTAIQDIISHSETPYRNAHPSPILFPTGGIRTRLGFVRPNYSLFRAHIIIHMIRNVPFTTGEFAVRWRFKDVQIRKERQLRDSNLDSLNTSAKGTTPFKGCDNHAVIWPCTLDAPLKINIDRETFRLSPCPLKLTVLQRIDNNGTGKPSQSLRFGAVYLDLAQFAGQGFVQRWYILQETKSNTTVKLTLDMRHVGGETNYISPPLAHPAVLESVDGLTRQNLLGTVSLESAQKDLQEFLALEEEVIAKQASESSKIAAILQTGPREINGRSLGNNSNQPSLILSPVADLLGADAIPEICLEEDQEREEQFDSGVLSMFSLRTLIKDNENGLHSSRTSSNSSYVSALSTISATDSAHESYHYDDISLYSLASSRTADTDYGLYYRRMALSQSTLDSGHTANL